MIRNEPMFFNYALVCISDNCSEVGQLYISYSCEQVAFSHYSETALIDYTALNKML